MTASRILAIGLFVLFTSLACSREPESPHLHSVKEGLNNSIWKVARRFLVR